MVCSLKGVLPAVRLVSEWEEIREPATTECNEAQDPQHTG